MKGKRKENDTKLPAHRKTNKQTVYNFNQTEKNNASDVSDERRPIYTLRAEDARERLRHYDSVTFKSV